jgi:hypothetical protein
MIKPLIGKRDKKKLIRHLLCTNCKKLMAIHRGHDMRCPEKRNRFSRIPNDMIWHNDESMIFEPSDTLQLTKEQKAKKMTQTDAIIETLTRIKNHNITSAMV